jgi:hypothetical protein
MTAGQRWTLVTVGATVLAFGIGAGWQYTRAADARTRLADAESRLADSERDLAFQRLENTLAAAAMEARRGRHEAARQLSSAFFTSLQSELERAPADAQQALRDILGTRDATITALSRAEPASADQLADLFSRYRVAFGEAVAPPAEAPPQLPATPVTTDTTDTIR